MDREHRLASIIICGKIEVKLYRLSSNFVLLHICTFYIIRRLCFNNIDCLKNCNNTSTENIYFNDIYKKTKTRHKHDL